MLLHGLKEAGPHIQEGNKFLKELVKRGLVLQIACHTIANFTNQTTQVPTQVADLLLEFEEVFATFVGLPPIRGHEHQIQLQEGAQAIC